jgi:predicted dehydrogenase
MRVIQVGLGGFGQSWAKIARATTGIELVAAVDSSPAARAWAIDAMGLDEAAVFADLEGALATIETDAVLVITPPNTHHAVATLALRAGKHVLLEKPLATTIEEARDLIQTAGAMGRILMVSQNYRYRPGAVAARQVVADGVLGDLAAVRVRCVRDTRTIWPADNFRYEMRHPFVLDMSIHHADLLRAITGQEVTTIYAQGWRVPDSPYQHDPAVAATLTLSGGATVLYEGDWATRAPETSWNGEWELIGERGRLTWTGPANDVMASTLLLQLRGEEPRTLPLPDLAVSDRTASLALFREAVMTGQEPETSARDNIRSLAIVLGCVASIESGGVVAPPSVAAETSPN